MSFSLQNGGGVVVGATIDPDPMRLYLPVFFGQRPAPPPTPFRRISPRGDESRRKPNNPGGSLLFRLFLALPRLVSEVGEYPAPPSSHETGDENREDYARVIGDTRKHRGHLAKVAEGFAVGSQVASRGSTEGVPRPSTQGGPY